MIQIVIADELSLSRDALNALLTNEPDFEVIGAAGDADAVVRMAVASTPDVLLLDSALAGDDGVTVLNHLGVRAPAVRTMMLVTRIEQTATLRYLKAGARGMVERRESAAVLCRAIRSVMQGEHWMDRSTFAMIINEMRRMPSIAVEPVSLPATAFNLTKRELDVVAGIVAGESNREVATRLAIREDTVKHHLSNVFDKVGVFSRLELAVFAMNHRLVAEEEPRELVQQPRELVQQHKRHES
jgi:two-component system, NarL family, nitrate/nitrite response regulator NarL